MWWKELISVVQFSLCSPRNEDVTKVMYSAAYSNSEERSRSQDDGPRKVDIVSDHIRGALERIDASKCVVLGFLKHISHRFRLIIIKQRLKYTKNYCRYGVNILILLSLLPRPIMHMWNKTILKYAKTTSGSGNVNHSQLPKVILSSLDIKVY